MEYPELLSAEVSLNPNEILDRMRRDHPIYWCEHPAVSAWLFTRYDDVVALFKEERLEFSNTKGELLKQPESEQRELESVLCFLDNMFPVMPDERYKILHSIWLQFFSSKETKKFRPRADKIVDGILDEIDFCSEVDLSKQYSYPVSAMIMTTIIGVPDNLRDQFVIWSKAIEALLWPYDYEKYKLANESLTAMIDCCKTLLYQQEAGEANLLSLLRETVESGAITEEEATVNCATTLFSGNELVATGINVVLDFLLRQPEVMASIINDMSQLPLVIRELMRYEPAMGWVRRTATQSFNYEGHNIKKDDVLYLGVHAANHDPKYFDSPHQFDISRHNHRPYLTFGTGIHSCTGAKLALLEIEIAVERLIRKYPEINLYPQNTPNSHRIMLMKKITEIPVRVF